MKTKLFSARGFIISAFVLASLISAYGLWPYVSAKRQHSVAKGGLGASVAGMKPGISVAYKISKAGAEPVTGIAIAAKDGTLAIPAHDVTDTSFVDYDFEIQNPEKPININVKISPKNGDALIAGRGLEKFSKVAIDTAGMHVATRSDWSGLFKDVIGLSNRPHKSSQPQTLRVALFNNDIMTDAADVSPLVIEVLNATGGGGPTEAGVNQSTCTGGLSVCNLTENNNGVINSYVKGLMLMTAQFSAVMMQQAQIIGSFIDAKTQIDTQKELQSLQAQAHKDYQPSDQMCRFGSFVKNISRAELKGDHDKMALNSILMASYLNRKYGNTGEGFAKEMDIRVKQFREVYCDPMDNNNGLQSMCSRQDSSATPADKQRFNKDIDFSRTVGVPLTLEIDFTDSPDVAAADEEDVIALARNLYWPRSFNLAQPASGLNDNSTAYMDSRHLAAMMNVAHNSYANIVSMKGASRPTIPAENSGPAFMKSLMREFGLSDADIESMLGANPSYYAQMEVLAKKIYQHPNFYTNLYDKPVNIDRIGVSMDAIELMQDRDEYESSLRREMLLSMMVEEAMSEDVKALNDTIVDAIKLPQ